MSLSKRPRPTTKAKYVALVIATTLLLGSLKTSLRSLSDKIEKAWREKVEEVPGDMSWYYCN
ncbi:hypothetical protein H4582DRAFT_2128330 [Lactarius indigo]|nr:hypothetical protein H4582DRAFT_2128330 [Lactarius indigo]